MLPGDLLCRDPQQLLPLKDRQHSHHKTLADFTGFPCLQMRSCLSLSPLPIPLTAGTQDLHPQPLLLCKFKMPAYTSGYPSSCVHSETDSHRWPLLPCVCGEVLQPQKCIRTARAPMAACGPAPALSHFNGLHAGLTCS